MNNNKKILVVEDEYSINDILTITLNKEGYEVKSVFYGREALEIIDDFKPDLVLLDLMLPDIDGFSVCKQISDKYLVIMITARGDVMDRILGMELGADDYIIKPFDIREVIVRVKAMFRRGQKSTSMIEDGFEKVTDNIKVNEKSRIIIKDNRALDLKRKEFDLFLYLYKNRNVVHSREALLDKVWGFEFAGDTRTVDVHIRRLRAKLEENEDKIIETVFGIGYVMR
ncbi:DNA-binding response regulator, OmpR family, contains REC and winged-helix (wHTH) domain [Clostridium cavendishii DSM 21758]|uniref:Stage 0 sporulation protein A homolog n=1 Tax=Clostridium cavendishii DSM 21758 TaxID=1121302 RepID=A0A1M6EFZ0_9CLOT|nr:response regulator transcription factor [Clostridium cavendishii]SHI84384.1 DNA-binding response regulator, OmpR family, contains REC and winged-helix (wHTH) domain [Clostridium cavendishii DSM 21758]